VEAGASVSESFDLDLAAAALRADARDTEALMAGLASWLEQSVPHLASVQRKRAGMFDARKRVTRIACQLGEDLYTIDVESAGVQARRARSVRGITLKTEPLTVGDWVSELTGALVREAKVTEASLGTLRQLLA
jgi:hypothetical protein